MRTMSAISPGRDGDHLAITPAARRPSAAVAVLPDGSVLPFLGRAVAIRALAAGVALEAGVARLRLRVRMGGDGERGGDDRGAMVRPLPLVVPSRGLRITSL